MKKTANIWEYKVGINDTVANFVFMWKYRIRQVLPYQDGVSNSMDPFRSALLSQHTRPSHWIGLFARCSTKERGIPLKAMCSTVFRLLSDKSSSWSDGRLANVPYFNTWEIKHNLHGISSFCEQPLATGRVNLTLYAFCMPQVPFAFEFESEWPNDNLATKQSPNYHSSDFGKVSWMAKW